MPVCSIVKLLPPRYRGRPDAITVYYISVAYTQIDWHDFVVVETVDFQPNEQGL